VKNTVRGGGSGLPARVEESAQLLPGTLDMLVLKAVSAGPEYGGIGQSLQHASRGVFDVNQGSCAGVAGNAGQ